MRNNKNETTRKEVLEDSPNRKPWAIIAIIVSVIIIAIVVAVVATVSSKMNETEQENIKTETVVEKPKVSEEVSSETAVDNTAEVEETQVAEEPVKMTLRDWSATIEYSEPKFAIWNFDIGQGKVLDNGDEYELLDGDNLCVYSPVEYKEILFYNGPAVERLDLQNNFTRITYKEEFKAKNDISLTVVGADGKDYDLNVCLISPNAPEEDTKVNEGQFSIYDWIKELRLTENNPKIIVWNETTGTKKIIENGEEYQLQEGDKTGIYYGKGYGAYYGQPDNTDSYETGYYYIQIQLVDEEKVDFEYIMASEVAELEDTKVYATFIK